MIDRLAAGLAALPPSTYDLILLLSDFDGSRAESSRILSRDVLARLVSALRPDGRIQSQDSTFAAHDGPERTEAILAGLVSDSAGGMRKPVDSGAQAVPLRFGRKSNAAGGPAAAAEVVVVTNGNGKRPSASTAHQPQAGPAGVGFVDFSDDLDAPVITGEDDLDLDFDDDDLIDENSLLTEADMARPVIPRMFLTFPSFFTHALTIMTIAPECRPVNGKRRRRACKDCTCGLAQRIEAEDAEKRAKADAALSNLHRDAPNGAMATPPPSQAAFKLDSADLSEIDFTVEGKVGSCGNCALGDAFRCDGCPYVGLPAFKPGEEVRLMGDVAQL